MNKTSEYNSTHMADIILLLMMALSVGVALTVAIMLPEI